MDAFPQRMTPKLYSLWASGWVSYMSIYLRPLCLSEQTGEQSVSRWVVRGVYQDIHPLLSPACPPALPQTSASASWICLSPIAWNLSHRSTPEQVPRAKLKH